MKTILNLIYSDSMKKSYAVVQQENGSLVGEYLKRTNNH
jgi:hypothetical protein